MGCARLSYVPRNKRKDEIKNYEYVEMQSVTDRKKASKQGNTGYEFEINYGRHFGFYSPNQISKFEECSVSSRVIAQRLTRLQRKEGLFLTIEEAIKAPIDIRVKKNNNDLLKERTLVKQTDMEWFNENIKLMNIGSLHNKSLIIQSRSFI